QRGEPTKSALRWMTTRSDLGGGHHVRAHRRGLVVPRCGDGPDWLALGWAISEAIDANLVCTALKSALWQRKSAFTRYATKRDHKPDWTSSTGSRAGKT